MIKVSVMYPNQTGIRFDMSYYLTKHMPLVRERFGSALKKDEVEEGIAGGAPGAPAPYVAVANLYFESVSAFEQAMAPHAAELIGDIPNYTTAQPTIQISAIKN
jgi:uncharacterized protein (TIGR02118 family)